MERVEYSATKSQKVDTVSSAKKSSSARKRSRVDIETGKVNTPKCKLGDSRVSRKETPKSAVRCSLEVHPKQEIKKKKTEPSLKRSSTSSCLEKSKRKGKSAVSQS